MELTDFSGWQWRHRQFAPKLIRHYLVNRMPHVCIHRITDKRTQWPTLARWWLCHSMANPWNLCEIKKTYRVWGWKNFARIRQILPHKFNDGARTSFWNKIALIALGPRCIISWWKNQYILHNKWRVTYSLYTHQNRVNKKGHQDNVCVWKISHYFWQSVLICVSRFQYKSKYLSHHPTQ